MNRFQSSFALMKESLAVLNKDREILLFPILAAVFGIIAFAVMVFPIVFTGMDESLGFVHLAVLYAFFFITNGIVIFFNTATIFCARKRLRGQDPTLGDGIRGAFSRFGAILGWAAISATVGLILRMAREKSSGMLARIAISILGAAWEFITFFVIPVYAFENLGPFAAIKRSVQLVKQTWGENLIVRFSMSFATTILFLIPLPILLIAFVLGGVPAGLVALGIVILYWILLGVVAASLSGVFTAALYEYATTKKVPEGFSREHIAGAFGHKEGRAIGRRESPIV